MLDRFSLACPRAADTAEHIAVHHFWLSLSVIATPVIACITAVVLA